MTSNRKQRLKFAVVLLLGIAIIVVGVASAPLPVRFYETLVVSDPDYVFDSIEPWERRNGEMMKLLVRLVDYRMRRDWTMHFVDHVSLSEEGNPGDTVVQVVNNLRKLMLSQREIMHEPLSQKNLSSLLRGYAFCESVNGALAMVLSQYRDGVEVFALRNKSSGESPHVLVRLVSPGAELYADAWTDIPLFTMVESNSGRSIGKVPSYDDVSTQDVYRLYPKETYLDGFVTYRHRRYNRWLYEFGRWFEPVADVFWSPIIFFLDRASTSAPKAEASKVAYLKARVNHLFGKNQQALFHYGEALRSPCDAVYCKAARNYHDRILSRMGVNDSADDQSSL